MSSALHDRLVFNARFKDLNHFESLKYHVETIQESKSGKEIFICSLGNVK